MIRIALPFLLSGLAIFSMSLPLVYRKVPMNGFYGIRIQGAFESEARWYEINAYGGRLLGRWSWLITAVGVAGFFVPPEHVQVFALAGVGIALFATLTPVVQIVLWSRKHTK